MLEWDPQESKVKEAKEAFQKQPPRPKPRRGLATVQTGRFERGTVSGKMKSVPSGVSILAQYRPVDPHSYSRALKRH